MSINKDFIYYLLSIGYKKINVNDDECTLFRMENHLYQLKDLEDLHLEEFNNSIKNNSELNDKVSCDLNLEDLPFEIEKESSQHEFLCEMLANIKTPMLFRTNIRGQRYYYEMTESGPMIFANGTGLIDEGYPDKYGNKALSDWRLSLFQKGIDPDKYAQLRADFGTITHILYAYFLCGKEFKVRTSFFKDLIKNIPNLRVNKDNLSQILEGRDLLKGYSYMEKLIENLLALSQFYHKRNVKVLAVEKMLRSLQYKVATAIDVILEMDDYVEDYFGEVYKSNSGEHKKGDPKKTKGSVRITTIMDFKSGEHFYNKHAFQLELNRRIVIENYGSILPEDIRLFNFSPNSSKEGLYTLKDQTNNRELRKSDLVFKLGMMAFEDKASVVKGYKGEISIHNPFEIENHIFEEDIANVLNVV